MVQDTQQQSSALSAAAAPFPNLALVNDLTFAYGQREYGSSGLRQFRGWIREEFLQQLVGRQAARVYREMQDNDPTIGALLFAVKQSMRSVDWNVTPADDSPEAAEYAEFVESLMEDMSVPWSQVIDEALSMITFGYAPLEIVYKKRLGRNDDDPSTNSRFSDGRIGIRKLALRGQETVIRWYLDEYGGIQGLQQQPWVGSLIDLPIEKLLLFRPSVHKNNPEGRSVLRNAYRSYFFVKRLEEQEAILVERMNGIPVVTLPKAVMDAANGTGAEAATAQAIVAAAKKIATNVRIDEQMGIVLPSDTFPGQNGPSNVPAYGFRLETVNLGRGGVDPNTMIERHKLQMMTTVLADFIALGHNARGSYNLATNKVDMFFQGIEGWLNSIASVKNRYLLPKLWKLNGFDPDLMPEFTPAMAERVDLDALSNFVLRLGQVGFLQPTPETEDYLRDAGNLPELPEDGGADRATNGLAKRVAERLLNDRSGL